MIFFSSDFHFFHTNILKYQPNRLFSTVEEMNHALVDSVNSMCTEKDILINLGDFGFFRSHEDAENIVASIRPKHILLFGNHCRRKMLSKAGLDAVGDELYLTYKGKTIWCNHFPAIRSQYDIDNNRQCSRPKAATKVDAILHGHCHSLPDGRQREFEGKLHLDVGVDAWDLKPVSIEDILQLC